MHEDRTHLTDRRTQRQLAHDAHDARGNRRRLTVVFALTLAYMIAEAVGGFLTNSLALLSDAGHMLTDAAALLLALMAIWFASRPVTPEKTYGYHRMEILAALANGIGLAAISLLIFYEALHRLASPEPVRGSEVAAIAVGGLIVNLISAWLLHDASEESLNVRGAFLHVLGDALGRTSTVYEPDQFGSLSVATTYNYDLLNNLTQVTQGSQIRKFKYDQLSRLLYSLSVEEAATINDGTGVFWSAKFTYDNNSNVLTRQDARLVTTTLGYDELNRVTSKTYSDTTPAVTLFYDTNQPASVPVGYNRGSSIGKLTAATTSTQLRITN